jgi:hypothetical protein
LASRFGLHIGFGNRLIGGAGADRGRGGLRRHGTIFTLAIKEQPTTGDKYQSHHDEYGKPHSPTAWRRVVRLRCASKIAILPVAAIAGRRHGGR